MKNITLSADDDLLVKAKTKAQLNKTTLNKLFRDWLNDYVRDNNIRAELDNFLTKTNYAEAGRRFTRDEYNER